MRVLVVDDDPALRRMLADILSAAGHTAETAVNGADALAQLMASPPDLVLLDLLMPVMGGEEFAERCQALPADRRAPVIVLSAVSDLHQFTARLQTLGVQAVLPKPPDLETLLTVIEGFASIKAYQSR